MEFQNRGWIPSNVISYMFTLYVLESLIVYGLKRYPEGIPGSTGLISEAVGEQCFKIPIPFRRINIQIIFYGMKRA